MAAPDLAMPPGDPDEIDRAIGLLSQTAGTVLRYLNEDEHQVQIAIHDAWAGEAGSTAATVVHTHVMAGTYNSYVRLSAANPINYYAKVSLQETREAVQRLRDRSARIAEGLRNASAVPNAAARMDAATAAQGEWDGVQAEYQRVMSEHDGKVADCAREFGFSAEPVGLFPPPTGTPALETAGRIVHVLPSRLDQVAGRIDPLIAGFADQAGRVRTAQKLLSNALGYPQLTGLVEPTLGPIGDELARLSSSSRDLAAATRTAARYYRDNEEWVAARVGQTTD